MTKTVCDSCGNDAMYSMGIYDTYKNVLDLDLCEKCYHDLTTIIKRYTKYSTTSKEQGLDYTDGLKYTE